MRNLMILTNHRYCSVQPQDSHCSVCSVYWRLVFCYHRTDSYALISQPRYSASPGSNHSISLPQVQLPCSMNQSPNWNRLNYRYDPSYCRNPGSYVMILPRY